MITLFFSYSHRDERLRDELEVHLAMMKRQGLLEAWHDRRIVAGDDIHGEISDHLETADVILLLVSPYFLASDYCYDIELARALERHEANEAQVIPVILEPCDWMNAPFQGLRATPGDGRPVSKFPNMHDAFLEITHDIRAAAERLGKARAEPDVTARSSRVVAPAVGPRSSNLRVRRAFTDSERDRFVDDVFEYVASFFENSLRELAARNADIEYRFKRVSQNELVASIYSAGEKRAACSIWLPGSDVFGGNIAYSTADTGRGQSLNDSMRVEDDGHSLGMRPLALTRRSDASDGLLTSQGVAEYFWSILVSPLQ